ncbi:MAG: ATP-binding protein [Succinivibrio sp.]|nr:ATP-binding protein [Succinivibrio sp.]
MAKEIVSTLSNTVMLKEQSELIELAAKFRLKGFVSELNQQFTNPLIFNGQSFEERLKKCFEEQEAYSKIAKFNSLCKHSLIRNKIRINQLKPSPSRGLTREHLELLSQTEYIKKCTNVIITGATGTGKTSLAVAAAMEAMSYGYSCRFYRINDLIALIECKDPTSFMRFKDTMRKVSILVIDDYGSVKIDDVVAVRLNEIADIRYYSGPTIITTQLKVSSLKEAIDPSPTRDALADRLFRPNDIEIVDYHFLILSIIKIVILFFNLQLTAFLQKV